MWCNILEEKIKQVKGNCYFTEGGLSRKVMFYRG